MTIDAPTRAIGYVSDSYTGAGNWWSFDPNETTPELWWPQSTHIFDQMRRQDAQVGSVLEAVCRPVLRTPWRIDPAGARDEVVEFVAEDLGLPIVGENPEPPARTKDRFSWTEHLELALLMLPFGHSYFEQLYRIADDGSKAHLGKLELRPARTIEQIDVARDGGLISITQYQLYGSVQKPITVDRLVAYIYKKEGANWLGRSILRQAFKNWLIKDRLLRVQAQTIERNGMGIPLYKAAEDGSPSDLAAGLAMAKAWRAGEAAGSAVPFGADLILRGVEGDLPDALPAIKYHDEQIARAVLAHFLNLDNQSHGSYALGTSFMDFFTLSLQTLAQSVADVASMHIVEDLVDVNWGPEEPAPRIVFDEIGSRQAATASSVKTLVDAGIITPDERLEESSRQQYGLPPAEPETARDPKAPNPSGGSITLPSSPPSTPTERVEARAPYPGQKWHHGWIPAVGFVTHLVGSVGEARVWHDPDDSDGPVVELAVGSADYLHDWDRHITTPWESRLSDDQSREVDFHGEDIEDLRKSLNKAADAAAGGRRYREEHFGSDHGRLLVESDGAAVILQNRHLDDPEYFEDDAEEQLTEEAWQAHWATHPPSDEEDDWTPTVTDAQIKARAKALLARFQHPSTTLSPDQVRQLARMLTHRAEPGQEVRAAAKFNPALHPHDPNTGRWRNTLDRVLDGLRRWAASGDKGNPFDWLDRRGEGFSREQLRRLGTQRGLSFPPRTSEKKIRDDLLDNLRDALAGDQVSPVKKAAKKAVPGKALPAKSGAITKDRAIATIDAILADVADNPTATARRLGGDSLVETLTRLRQRLDNGETPPAGLPDVLDRLTLRFSGSFAGPEQEAISASIAEHTRQLKAAVEVPKLAPAKTPDRLDLAKLRSLDDPEAIRDALDLHKVPELKDALREQKLALSGRKRELVDRLVEHLAAGKADGRPAEVAKKAAPKRKFSKVPPLADEVEQRARQRQVRTLLREPDATDADWLRGKAQDFDDDSRRFAAIGDEKNAATYAAIAADLREVAERKPPRATESPSDVVGRMRDEMFPDTPENADVRQLLTSTQDRVSEGRASRVSPERAAADLRNGSGGYDDDTRRKLLEIANALTLSASYRSKKDDRPLPRAGEQMTPDQARARFAEIDAKRKVADMLTEALGLVHNDADEDVARRRITALALANGVDDATRDALLAAVEQAREVEVENKIREAYRDAAASSGREHLIPLADIRERLADLDRSEVDAALTRMARGGAASLTPNEDRKRRTQRDRDAALRIPGYGSEDANDWLTFDDPSPQPNPLTETTQRLARDAGLTPVAQPGQVVPFDRKRHESIYGSPQPGEKVGVEEAGYSLELPNGETVQLSKAKVSTYDPKLHGPEPTGAPTEAGGVPARPLTARQLRLLNTANDNTNGRAPVSKAAVRDAQDLHDRGLASYDPVWGGIELTGRGRSRVAYERANPSTATPEVAKTPRKRAPKKAVRAAAGRDITPGHDELHHWWVYGPGKKRWKTWTELYTQLAKIPAIGPIKAKPFASRWFFERYRFYSGSDLNRVKHGKPPRGRKVGPG